MAQRQRGLVKHASESSEDYGYNNPPEVVEAAYWERLNFGTLPESGGLLDQPRDLMDDMQTMHWLLSMANAAIDEEEEIAQVAKAATAKYR